MNKEGTANQNNDDLDLSLKAWLNFIDGLIRIIESKEPEIQAAFRKVDEKYIYINNVSHLLFVKSFKTLKAIHKLCLYGLWQDAMILSRSLFENLLCYFYISESDELEKQDTLAKRYLDFSSVSLHRRATKLVNLCDDTQKHTLGTQNIIQDTREQSDKATTKHNYKKRDDWLDDNKRDRADKLGLLEYYDTFYIYACGLSHSDAEGCMTVIAITPNGECSLDILEIIKDEDGIKECLINTFKIFRKLFDKWRAKHGIIEIWELNALIQSISTDS